MSGKPITSKDKQVFSIADDAHENEQFLSSASCIWTVLDQKRLTALVSLHHRALEYHTNASSEPQEPEENVLSNENKNENDMKLFDKNHLVADILRFVPEEGGPSVALPLNKLELLCKAINKEKASKKYQDSNDCFPFTWIHLRDINALGAIAGELDMHELIIAGFYDLRAHSIFLPAKGEMLLAFVTCELDEFDFHMYKIYIYVSKEVIVTLQVELLVETSDADEQDKIVGPLMQTRMDLRPQCLQNGPLYLAYQIIVSTLGMINSVVDFVSYSLSYFNSVVHLKLLHRERLAILVKMHNINAGIGLFSRLIDDANSTCKSLVDIAVNGAGEENRKGLGALLCPDLIKDVHIPYILSMADAFAFVLDCLHGEMSEAERLEKELDATMALRATNTSIVLSLIATIFLPLTFFAGVFGMNFTEGGGYTISLLNSPDGPSVFIILCLVSAIFSVMFFIYQGWLESGVFGKIFRIFQRTSSIEDKLVKKKNVTKERQTKAVLEALEEERRKKEIGEMRTSYIVPTLMAQHNKGPIRTTVTSNSVLTQKTSTSTGSKVPVKRRRSLLLPLIPSSSVDNSRPTNSTIISNPTNFDGSLDSIEFSRTGLTASPMHSTNSNSGIAGLFPSDS